MVFSIQIDLITVLLISISTQKDFVLAEGDISAVLEHNLFSSNDELTEQFSQRGTLKFLALNRVEYQSSREIDSSELRQLKYESHLQAFVSKNEFYRVRIPALHLNSGDLSENHVSAVVTACLLYESRLSDVLTITVGQSGRVIGLSLGTPQLACRGEAVDDQELRRFNTTVIVQQAVLGPQPETQAYIQKIEKEKLEQMRTGGEDNRSFFQKYWMYIVIGVFAMVLLQAFEQPPEGGG